MGVKSAIFTVAALIAVGLGAGPANAELAKTATMDCGAICLHVWPKILIPDGWAFDAQFSNANNVNFIYPLSGPANTAIYAGALPADQQADTIEGLIADDRAYILRTAPPGMTAQAGPDFTTQDGQVLHSIAYVPGKRGNWDITAYGEEVDPDGGARYYLTFTLSAPTLELREQYLPVLKTIIAAYHK